MNWDEIQGTWKQLAGTARQRWGKLTDDDWEVAAGDRERLVSIIQQRYGVAKAEAAEQAEDWARALKRAAGATGSALHL